MRATTTPSRRNNQQVTKPACYSCGIVSLASIPQLPDVTPVDPSSTWAGRNPSKDIIPPRQNVKRKQTETEKRTAELRRQKSRKALDDLKEGINTFLENEKAAIAELAIKHGRKQEYVEKLVKGTYLYGKKCSPSLYNALLHAKAKELNEGN